MNATLKGTLGIALAIASTAGLAGVMGLELQRSFDPTSAERAAVQRTGRSALGSPDAGAETTDADPSCC